MSGDANGDFDGASGFVLADLAALDPGDAAAPEKKKDDTRLDRAGYDWIFRKV